MIQPVFRTDFSFFPSDTSICPSLTPQYVLQKLWFLPPICSSWSSHISVSKPVSLTRSFPSVHWKSSSTVRSFSPIQALSWPRPSTETPAQSESVTSLHSERLLYPHARPHPPLLFHSFWRFLFLSSPAYFSYHFICTWIACCDLFPPLLFTLPCMALWTNIWITMETSVSCRTVSSQYITRHYSPNSWCQGHKQGFIRKVFSFWMNACCMSVCIFFN